MTNEQLNEIVINAAKGIGEGILADNEYLIPFARRLLAEVQKMQEPVAWRKKLLCESETGEVYEEWKYSELHHEGVSLLRNAEPLYKALEIET